MEIIALTEGGCMISATKDEVKSILTATSGVSPKGITIGQKLPAIDYASTIHKIKALKENYYYNHLVTNLASFNACAEELKAAVETAADIDV